MRRQDIPVGVIVAPDGQPAIFKAIEGQWYEGSLISPNRSFNYFPVNEADRDLDQFTRYELIRHSQYLVKNSPLIRGLINRLVTLTIGTGIHPVPESSNEDWNTRAKRYWRRVGKAPCVDTFDTMSEYQRIKTFERFMDGESFTILTYDNQTHDPGLQGKQATQITSQKLNGNPASPNAILPVDGIVQNKQGKPIAYDIRGSKKSVPAQFVVHHKTSFRSSQHRGEPILASAINWARDVDDIIALEKQSVKTTSGVKDVIKTPSGTVDPETFRKMAISANAFPTTSSMPLDADAKTNWYKAQFGAETMVLRSGDEYQSVAPNRPSAAWAGFMAFLSQTICLSTGIPPSILLPVDVGGTDIRRDLEIAQRCIEAWQLDIAGEWQRIWEYLVGESVQDGELSQGAPDDWDQVLWYFPKSITVDRGRDAIQDRADVQAGLMSRGEYHGRYGDNGEDYEKAVELEVRKRRLRLTGVPIEQKFQDIHDYVMWLSVSDKMLTSMSSAMAGGDGGTEATPPAKQQNSGVMDG